QSHTKRSGPQGAGSFSMTDVIVVRECAMPEELWAMTGQPSSTRWVRYRNAHGMPWRSWWHGDSLHNVPPAVRSSLAPDTLGPVPACAHAAKQIPSIDRPPETSPVRCWDSCRPVWPDLPRCDPRRANGRGAL